MSTFFRPEALQHAQALPWTRGSFPDLEAPGWLVGLSATLAACLVIYALLLPWPTLTPVTGTLIARTSQENGRDFELRLPSSEEGVGGRRHLDQTGYHRSPQPQTRTLRPHRCGSGYAFISGHSQCRPAFEQESLDLRAYDRTAPATGW